MQGDGASVVPLCLGPRGDPGSGGNMAMNYKAGSISALCEV